MSNPSVKRRNHEVPRGLLKNWIGLRGPDRGFHYWDLHDFKYKFEKGKQAQFAITEYLYVPQIKSGERDDALEDWFSVDENGLAFFARAAQTGQLENNGKPKLLSKAIRACVALGSRSAYQFYCVGTQLARHEEVAKTSTVHLAVVQNAWKFSAAKFREFMNWDFLVLYDLPVELLVNERPFSDWSMTTPPIERVTMPLGPTALLIGYPPANRNRKEAVLEWYRSTDEGRIAEIARRIVEPHNHLIVVTARQWIVSRTEQQLTALASELTEDRLEERLRLDQVALMAFPRVT